MRNIGVVFGGALLLAVLPDAAAQTPRGDARLTVRVVDTAGQRLPYAEVTLVEPTRGYSTDAQGRVAAIRLKPGRYQVAARAIGYRSRSLTLLLSAGQTLDTVIVLTAVPLRLPDLATRGDVSGLGDLYARLRLRGGRVITRMDIDRHWAIRSVDLLTGMLGVRVDHDPGGLGGTTIGFPGCRYRPMPVVAVWLNGREMIGSPYRLRNVVSALDLVRARELEFMEVYRRPDEIPGRFRSGDACAALIMWTQGFVKGARLATEAR